MRFAVLAGCIGLASASRACSGRHVQETIQAAIHVGQIGAAVTIVFLLAALLLRLRIAAFVCIAGVLLHPAWTTSAVSGDCGDGKVSATFLTGIICGGVLLWDALRRTSVGLVASRKS